MSAIVDVIANADIIGVHDTPELVGRVSVTLNGAGVQAVRACVREGWVDVYKRDDAGRLVLNVNKDAVIQDRLYGAVSVVPKEIATT